MGRPSHLYCSKCSSEFSPEVRPNLCHCGAPLLVHYDWAALKTSWTRHTLSSTSGTTMWRYLPVLPAASNDIVSLHEGWTPLIRTRALHAQIGASNLWIKDEGQNPTGSFKARGLSCAISMAKKFGIRKVAIPSAGNAGGALAAYAAAAGLEAHIFMPTDVPHANFLECKAYGANVVLVNGLISDCARLVAERTSRDGWFDVSTLKEPYRIEGKKTMGYEIAEQFNWNLPDAILYPCGGGVGLIGIWKAFNEMEQLGWIDSRRPKLIAVQAEGCRPIVQAFNDGKDSSEFWPSAHTVAAGLRVPKPLGDALILRAIRETNGLALAVPDEEILDAALLLAQSEGIFAAPEGGACVAAARRLLRDGFLKPEDQIVILNTGSGLKYMEAYSARFHRHAASEHDKLGGLITPR